MSTRFTFYVLLTLLNIPESLSVCSLIFCLLAYRILALVHVSKSETQFFSSIMAFVCALSGDKCIEPVVSPISGKIFEKRLILKYLETHGNDPFKEEPLSAEQLVILDTENDIGPPRNLQVSSIPQLLKMLQDEYDAVILNGFMLRQKLTTARQELSDTLYQHDAATRVIARLSQELATAREALSTLRPNANFNNANAKSTDVEMEDTQAFDDVVVERIAEKSKELTAIRKQRGKKVPEGLTTPEELKEFKEKSSHTALHSTGVPGITALDVRGPLALTGGADKDVVLFNYEKEKVISHWKGHTKKVTSVLLHPNNETAVSASADSTIRVWKTGEESQKFSISCHSATVSDLSMHPVNDYVLSVSVDGAWGFSDISTGTALIVHRSRDGDKPLHCGQFHPDGLIFGTGTDDCILKIWDLRAQTNAANFPGHEGPVRCMAFSEIGFHLASGSDDGTVKLWDLRKLSILKTMQVGDGKTPVSSVAFDFSGTYLAVGAADVRVLHVKPWNVVNEWSDHTANVTGVRFVGTKASALVSSGMDKALRVYSA